MAAAARSAKATKRGCLTEYIIFCLSHTYTETAACLVWPLLTVAVVADAVASAGPHRVSLVVFVCLCDERVYVYLLATDSQQQRRLTENRFRCAAAAPAKRAPRREYFMTHQCGAEAHARA